MNYSTAIFLVNPAARAVLVSYEADAEGKGVKPFTMFKTLDPTVQPGDFVVIPTSTRHKQTVVRVEEVDAEVDFESSVQVEWLIGHAPDLGPFQAVLTMEAEGITQIKSAEKKAKADELKAKLIADNPALATLGAVTPPALAAPTPPLSDA